MLHRMLHRMLHGILIVGSVFVILALQVPVLAGETNDIRSFVQDNPAKVRQLFASLDLSYPGMTKVAKAVKHQDMVAACKALLEYYHDNPSGAELRNFKGKAYPPWAARGKNLNPDDMIKDKFTIGDLTAVVPRDANGHLKWNYIPPNSYKQYPTELARFNQGNIAWYKYKKTGNDKYAKFVNDHIIDWIKANPYMTKRVSDFKSVQCFGGRSEGYPSPNYTWFTLHSSIRLVNFVKLFYSINASKNIADATKLLLLCSIEEHCNYLYHRAGMRDGNKAIYTMNNLLYAAIYFPEFTNNAKWREAAVSRVEDNINKCVYPDGAQDELALMYAFGVLRAEFAFFKKLKKSKINLSSKFTKSILHQLFFLAVCSMPDGKMMPHGDSSTNANYSKKLLKMAVAAELPEVVYIASAGKKGKMPANPPSRFFNYSGFGVSRDKWNNAKLWSFFDAGPYGAAHSHADKLQLCIYNRRMILIDPGKYGYNDIGGWTPEYFLATRGHNTIMLDGHDQNMYIWYKENGPNDYACLKSRDMIASGPVPPKQYEITPAFDRFSGKVEVGYRKGGFYSRSSRIKKNIPKKLMKGKASHERTVYFKRGQYWLVFDRIRGNKKRRVDALWHFHPDCKLEKLTGGRVATVDANKGNLLIVPANGGAKLTPELVKGKGFQGWYAPKTNCRIPTWCAVYSGDVRPNAYFAWLMLPFDGENVPEASVRIISVNDKKVKLEVKIGESILETVEFSISV